MHAGVGPRCRRRCSVPPPTWRASCAAPSLWPQRLVLRSSYVGLMTLIAVLMPFFSPMIGLIGAISALAGRAYMLAAGGRRSTSAPAAATHP